MAGYRFLGFLGLDAMIKALHVTVETAERTAVVWLQYISRKLCAPQPEPPTVDAAGKEAAAKIMDISQSFGVSAQATSETLQTHGGQFQSQEFHNSRWGTHSGRTWLRHTT